MFEMLSRCYAQIFCWRLHSPALKHISSSLSLLTTMFGINEVRFWELYICKRLASSEEVELFADVSIFQSTASFGVQVSLCTLFDVCNMYFDCISTDAKLLYHPYSPDLPDHVIIQKGTEVGASIHHMLYTFIYFHHLFAQLCTFLICL